ncbi:MAG TPA: methyltransferase domain-containing protein [Actinocrinis sp.]|nr:methyltransferase domain-containing protein [Actinocrinis sp.]
MIHQILKPHAHTEGTVIDRVHLYEGFSALAFLGRRRRVYRRIVALSGAQPGDRVLDVGCNGGYLVRLFAKALGADGRVCGIDPSETAIEYARRRAPDTCSFTVGVAQDLGFPTGSFDVVASTLAVHHIPETERETAFREMHRVLRPGGRLLVADFRPGAHGPHTVGKGMSHINPDELDAFAENVGFKVEGRGDLPMLRYVQAMRPA